MNDKPTVYCTAFNDNSGAVELLHVPKMRPRTKHINPKYQHFCRYVARKEISVEQVKSQDQLADIMMKNLPTELFVKFCKLICGW
jgi:hypothetical protein